MGFPTINGAPINAEEGGDISLLPAGLDLLAAGAHTAVGSTIAGEAQPLELGEALVQFALQPDGLDLVANGIHIGLHDLALAPPGLDIVSHGTPIMVVNPVAGDADVLEFGALTFQIGVPIHARPVGLDLVVAGLHVAAVSGVVPSDKTTVAGNARPLELGIPAVAPGPDAATAGGASPLEMGDVTMGLVLIAGAAEPLEMGAPAIGAALVAGGAMPLELQAPTMSTAFPVLGMELVVAGVHRVANTETSTVAGGATPLELGVYGPLGFAAITRQQFPLSLGTPLIHRGTSC